MPANAQTGKVLMEMAWTDKQRLLLAESKVREKSTPGYAGNSKAKRKDLFVLLYFEVAKEYTQEYVRPDFTAGCLDKQWKKIEGQYQRIVNDSSSAAMPTASSTAAHGRSGGANIIGTKCNLSRVAFDGISNALQGVRHLHVKLEDVSTVGNGMDLSPRAVPVRVPRPELGGQGQEEPRRPSPLSLHERGRAEGREAEGAPGDREAGEE